MKYLKQLKALSVIRLRLLWNTLASRAGIGKIIGMSFVILITIIATASGASDLLEAILKQPYAFLLSQWAVGLLVSFAIFIEFTGDLVSGHTLNTGQMSSDFHYLATLPIPIPILIFTKIFERIITDYFGILFLLPALVGISCHKAYTIDAFLAGFLLYLEIGIISGLLINLIMIALSRYFKPSAIKNIFSVFGYISALLTLIPCLFISDFKPSYIPKILEIIDFFQEYASWLIAPIRWLATPLLLSTPFCEDFGKITILWFLLTIGLTTVFYLALKNNWAFYAHSNKAAKSKVKRNSFFKGLLYKEFVMLKSDLNLLVNAVIMPISIILTEMYFLKKVFTFTSINSVTNFIFGSIIYFSMFGPVAAIGYEGKSIALLETMPITPANLIKQKFKFWFLLALIIFLPSTIVTFLTIGFDLTQTITAVMQTIGFAAASVWLSVSFSAIFAQYSTSVLQQRSSFIGKTAAMFLLTLLLYVKNLSWLSLYTVVIFSAIACICYLKAQNSLLFRQDKEMLSSDDNTALNCLLMFLGFIALETSISQFFHAISPDSDTGAWNWCLSVAVMLPFFVIYRKKQTPYLPKISLANTFRVVITTAVSLLATYFYFKFSPSIYEEIMSNTNQIINFGKMFFIPTNLWAIILFLIAASIMVAITKRAEEHFLADESRGVKLLGCLLPVLAAPSLIILPILFFMLTVFVQNIKEHKKWLCFYSSIPYFAALFWFLIF